MSGNAGRRWGVLFLLGALATASSCTSSDGVTNPPVVPPVPPVPPDAVSLNPGVSASLVNGQQIDLAGGAAGGEFVLVVSLPVADTSTKPAGTGTYQLTATGIGAPGTVSGPSTSRSPSADASLIPSSVASFDQTVLGAPTADIGYGTRLNERSRRRFVSMLDGTRRSLAPLQPGASSPLRRSSSLVPSFAVVGDLLTYNVSARACDSIVNHAARVVAVGAKSMIVADTLNPAGGFTSADYQRIAANFDTLVYPLDVTNFGTPTDIDNSGRVVLLFTRAVNELTKANSKSYVGGFFFARDLFSKTASAATQACAGSNFANMFYLLAPDPTGIVNGNVRRTGFVDSLITGVVGHEFQHLINASRRIYINNASDFETVWLNEGLSHIAEELLFYRQSGLTPRQNIDVAAVRTSAASRNAFNQDQTANAGRYREYLLATSTNSPIRNDDSLATRGATWDLLRYAADRKLRAGGPEVDVWQALVNSTTSGLPNLRAVFGRDIGGMLRDWSVSHYTDDIIPGVIPDYLQPSWNWHNIYPALGGGGGTYPLLVKSLTTGPTSGTIIPGAAEFYRFAIPANTKATIALSGGGVAASLPQGTVVRVR